MDSVESEYSSESHEPKETKQDASSPSWFLPSLEAGLSNIDILRGSEAIWALGPKAQHAPSGPPADLSKWADALHRLRDHPERYPSEVKAFLKHLGIPLDLGPYEQWVVNITDSKIIQVILETLPQMENLIDDYELSLLAANLLRLVARAINDREDVWKGHQTDLRDMASEMIERHQDNMFGRRNLAFLCLETGNYKEANKILDRAIQDMKDEKALCGKGIALKHLGKKQDALDWFEKASQKNPKNPYIWRERGEILLELGRTEDALDCFRASLKLRPTWGEIWEIIGYTYEEAGNEEESKECLARASKLLPSPERREEWAVYQAALSPEVKESMPLVSGPPERAQVVEIPKEDVEKLEAERRELDELRMSMEEKEREIANKFNELRDMESDIIQEGLEKESVVDILSRVASIEKENVLEFWRKGYTTVATFREAQVQDLVEAGNIPKSAAKMLKKLAGAEAKDRDEAEMDDQKLFENAMGYLEEERYEQALDCLNTVTKRDPDNEEAWYNKAEIFSVMGKTKEALNSYERALELNPKNQKAWMERANMLMTEGFPVEAIRSLRRFLELDPKNAQYLRERAETYFYASDYGNAILCYNSILQVEPKDVDALIGLGDSMLQLSDVEEADKFFLKAIKLAPSDERAWCKRAHILNRKGRWGAAIQLYNRSIALKWNYSEPWIGKAEIHLRQGSYEVAIDGFDKALKINSKDPKAWYGKGLALERLGEFEKATRCFKKALDLDEAHDEAREGLDRMKFQEEIIE